MASIRLKCIFCAHDFDVPQDASSLDVSTHAKICDPCSSAFNEGTFCLQFHKHEDGWTQCGVCGKGLHRSCIMALNTFELSAAWGIICNECVTKQSLQATNRSASSSIALPVNGYQMNASSSSFESFTGERLPTDSRFGQIMDNVPLDLGNAATERRLNPFQWPSSGLIFLFEKKLTATDCNIKAGRFLIPKIFAEAYLPILPGIQKMPLVTKDTEGRTWNFNLRWWNHKKSKKYVIDGIRGCVRRMKWTTGDTLKFYRQLPDGDLIMELLKANASTSAR